jgi:hypothetical protein
MSAIVHAERCVCGDSPLEPEKSVPVTGFSRELRLAADVERYWFSFALRGDVPLPVHLVFSPSERAAEIKAGDLKAFRVASVSSPCEARLRWTQWWRTGHSITSAFAVPRRTGRLPRPSPVAS